MLQENELVTEELQPKKSIKKKVIKAVVIYFTIQAIINVIIQIKKHQSKKREEGNDKRGIKEFYSFMDGRKISLANEKFRGMIVKQFMSGLDIDLSGAIFDEDSFLTVDSFMSGLHIRVPEHVNVKVDGKNVMSGVANTVPEYLDEDTPTLYIAAKTIMSGLAVKVKEVE